MAMTGENEYRVPCGKEDFTYIAGRELEVNGKSETIEFPPRGVRRKSSEQGKDMIIPTETYNKNEERA